ncbi:MAG TPA: Snf7 family protein [Nitrosarchaeum sp.]|nr:Snf7 family protein [Nitrosarchaeum sp.]
MISNSWNKAEGESISQRVMGKVRPDIPLKTRIEEAQRKLQFQISKLEGITEKLQKKHDGIFEKVVNAQKSHNNAYAQAYANELVQVRKMKNMVSGAKLSMEQIQLRLNTVSELGDVVVTLSPCMSIIKGLSPSLSGIMPEATSSMQDLSQILGDVMIGSSIEGSDLLSAGSVTNSDTLAILEEAHSVIAGQTKSAIPDIPDSLKHDIVQRRSSDVLI